MVTWQTRFILKTTVLAAVFSLSLLTYEADAASVKNENTDKFKSDKNVSQTKNSDISLQNGQLAFEKLLPTLTDEHISFITKSIKPAGLPVVLGFALKGTLDCDNKHFIALEQALSLEYLQAHALNLMVFAHWETRKLHKLYQLRTAQLLKTWNRDSDKDLIKFLETQNDPQKSSIEVYQRGRVSLAKHFHLSGQAIERKLKTLINLAPSCLSAVNLKFPDKVRLAVTKDRAQKIGIWLKQKNESTEASQRNMASNTSKQILMSELPSELKLDGYGNPFELRLNENSMICISKGRLEDSTADDSTYNFQF